MAILRFGRAAVVTGLAALMVTACQPSGEAPRPRPRPPGPIIPPPRLGPAVSDAAYMASAASIAVGCQRKRSPFR